MEGVVFMMSKEQRDRLKPAFVLYEKIGAAIGSSKGQDVLNAFAILIAANCSARRLDDCDDVLDYLCDETSDIFRSIAISGEIRESNVVDIQDFMTPLNKKDGH